MTTIRQKELRELTTAELDDSALATVVGGSISQTAFPTGPVRVFPSSPIYPSSPIFPQNPVFPQDPIYPQSSI